MFFPTYKIAKQEYSMYLCDMKAPVAMFVYNRVDNTQKTLEHLLANEQAKETDLYVFSDGGKDSQSWQAVNAVREYLHKVKADVEREGTLKSMTIVERKENIYLERNITEGIAQVFETHDRIIVLEDDICTSPYYLRYMNDAFDTYKDVKRVMHVAGFTNLDLAQEGIYFTPHMSGWGWGTWRDRWQTHFIHYATRPEALQGMSADDMSAIQYGGAFPCLKSLDKRPIPWDICWELAIYKRGGLCLTPCHTMVRNIGLLNGTHFRASTLLQHYEYDRQPLQHPLDVPLVDNPQADPHIESLFAQAITDWGIRYTPLGKCVRAVYKLAMRILHR